MRKYIVDLGFKNGWTSIESESRNAKKHLMSKQAMGCLWVQVRYKGEVVSKAELETTTIIKVKGEKYND